MDLDIKYLDCTHDKTGEKFIVDLSSDAWQGEPWTMTLPAGMLGHELVSCTEVHRGGLSSKQKEINKEITSITFFIPTPGRSETVDGNHITTWEFHPQHVDFMIAYFDGLDSGILNKPLVINFADESPKLEQCIPQLYSCMQLFDISADKVILVGNNFDGQEQVNKYASKENVNPVKYVVQWNMHGHLDTADLEKGIDRSVPGKLKFVSWDQEHWYTSKGNTFTFLNRRYSESRAVALWALFLVNTWKYKSIVSAFPPQVFHKIGKAEGVGKFLTVDYFKQILARNAPMMRNQLTADTFDTFKKYYKLGQSIPGDHAYIGAVESKYAPQMENSYVWYTCETVADHENVNTFYTEKVLKPMVYGQGLILYGQPGMIAKFKKLGFHTLAEELGFSEDYDNIVDSEKRLKAISKEIATLCEVPLSEMHLRWLKARPKIEENRKRMMAQLTNIEGNFWDNICNYTNEKIKEPYNVDKLKRIRTVDVLKEYHELFDIEQFSDN
jgi:hypothetical protein|tara:strand:- start:7404 stop:8897 length:1494 start_codon:yes stop_codon:yes gene_type:complete